MATGTRMWSITSAVAVLAVTIGGSVAVAVPVSAAADSATTPVTSLDLRASKNAPKAGKKCKKRGKSVTTAAGTFTCKKKGKKLVWKKTANPVTPAPTPVAPAPVPVTPASPTPPPAETGSSAVSDGGPTKVTSGGVTVLAAAGAIGTGQTLSITKAPEEASVPDVAGDKLAAPVFDISSSQGQPSGPVTVTMAYDAAKLTEGGAPLVLHEDTELGLWAPEETTVNPDGTVSATFDHFSLFSVAARGTWAVGVLTGNRSTENTDCVTTPDWVVNTGFTTAITESLLSCAGPGSTSDTLRLNLVNNRGYPMLLEVDGAGFSPEESWFSDSYAGTISAALGRVLHAAQPTKVALPAGSKATLVFHRPTGANQMVTIDAVDGPATGPTQMAIRYAQKAAEATAPVEVIDCFAGIAYNGTNDLSVADLATDAQTCIDLADDSGALSKKLSGFLTKVAKALFFVDSGQYIADNFVDAQFPPHAEFRMNNSTVPPGQTPPPPPPADEFPSNVSITTDGQPSKIRFSGPEGYGSVSVHVTQPGWISVSGVGQRSDLSAAYGLPKLVDSYNPDIRYQSLPSSCHRYCDNNEFSYNFRVFDAGEFKLTFVPTQGTGGNYHGTIWSSMAVESHANIDGDASEVALSIPGQFGVIRFDAPVNKHLGIGLKDQTPGTNRPCLAVIDEAGKTGYQTGTSGDTLYWSYARNGCQEFRGWGGTHDSTLSLQRDDKDQYPARSLYLLALPDMEYDSGEPSSNAYYFSTPTRTAVPIEGTLTVASGLRPGQNAEFYFDGAAGTGIRINSFDVELRRENADGSSTRAGFGHNGLNGTLTETGRYVFSSIQWWAAPSETEASTSVNTTSSVGVAPGNPDASISWNGTQPISPFFKVDVPIGQECSVTLTSSDPDRPLYGEWGWNLSDRSGSFTVGVSPVVINLGAATNGSGMTLGTGTRYIVIYGQGQDANLTVAAHETCTSAANLSE